MIKHDSILIPLSKRGKKYKGVFEAIVDEIDADLLDYNWMVQIKSETLRYAATGTEKIFMHRVILKRMLGRELHEGEYTDHINGNGLDNRRGNLRVATHGQNQMNSRLQKTGSSTYKGVRWHRSTKRWQSNIGVNGKYIWLGLFDDELEAHRAYCEASIKHHGEFANFGETSPFTREDFK